MRIGLYARVAKDNNLSFIALKIKNNGEKPINPATDLVYRTNDGQEITPMTCEEVMNILVEPVTETTGTNPNVDVNSDVWRLGIFVNKVKKATSHYKFVKDIVPKYVSDQIVAPHSAFIGYIALPVKESVPITIYLVERMKESY